MKKKLLAVILVVLTVLSLLAIPVSAYYGEDGKTYKDGIFTYSLDENGNASITDCSDKSSKIITIPSEVGGHPVKDVRIECVADKMNVDELVFSEGIEEISGWYREENNIKRITFPKSLKYIGIGIFSDWIYKNLTDIYYGGTPFEWSMVTVEIVFADEDNFAIDKATMHYNGENDDVAIWDGDYEYIVTDGKAVITDCSLVNSSKIQIPDTLGGYPVSGIGQFAFFEETDDRAYTTNAFKYKEIVFPDTLEFIGGSACYGANKLERVIIPNSVRVIGNAAFASCLNLVEIELPEVMTKIGSCAFHSCGTKEITVPYGITTVECGAVEIDGVIRLPQTVTEIESIFFDIPWAEDMTIYVPISVKKMPPPYILEGGKMDVFYEGSESDWNNIDFGEYSDISDMNNGVTVHYNCEMDYAVKEIKEDGEGYTYVETTDNVIITDFDETASGEVEIPENINGKPITEIGDETFKDCTGITEVRLPSTVEKIGESAFENSGIVRFVIPEKVELIESRTFYRCKNLESVEIPLKVREIKTEAFEKCEKLVDVYYSGSEEDWGKISIADGENSVVVKAENHYEKTMPRNNKIFVVMLVVMVLLAVMAIIIVILIVIIKRKGIESSKISF